MDVECCSTAENNTCEQRWGAKGTCEQIPKLKCVPGCVSDLNGGGSSDCKLNQTCVANKCVRKACHVEDPRAPFGKYDRESNDDMSPDSLLLTDHGKGTLNVMEEAQITCETGFVFHHPNNKTSKSMKVKCMPRGESSDVGLVPVDHREIPLCQKGCHSDEDCSMKGSKCFKGEIVRVCFSSERT